ncbi:hypothetical protein Vadar_010156 [Vaccinium darrowii]|uniref:Uncharacterized protein n=1 Tax=Vaccinium darrowii TaxID=229202 RepID=A0ACB7YKS5_9ERIC|nr:hypothetical protein Vadar_010156 [Vaccinium darrowii]
MKSNGSNRSGRNNNGRNAEVDENLCTIFGNQKELKTSWTDTNPGVLSEFHFANLTSLEVFDASGNQLVLRVIPNWSPPFQLKAMSVRSLHLGPQFPMWLQKGFRYMDLSGTGISDSVPQWFWNLSSRFLYLNLSHNQINGKIPNIPKLDRFVSRIYLGSKQLRGPLSPLSSNVTEQDLSSNSFSGEISNFLCDRQDEPNKLEILHLGENQLSGEIPDCWENCRS